MCAQGSGPVFGDVHGGGAAHAASEWGHVPQREARTVEGVPFVHQAVGVSACAVTHHRQVVTSECGGADAQERADE